MEKLVLISDTVMITGSSPTSISAQGSDGAYYSFPITKPADWPEDYAWPPYHTGDALKLGLELRADAIPDYPPADEADPESGESGQQADVQETDAVT